MDVGAQGVLDARAHFPAATLAYLFELYQKLTAPLIPTATVKAKRGKQER